MALYLQNISKSSKNYPGVNSPGNFFFKINDNINEPVRQHIDVVINFFFWIRGKMSSRKLISSPFP